VVLLIEAKFLNHVRLHMKLRENAMGTCANPSSHGLATVDLAHAEGDYLCERVISLTTHASLQRESSLGTFIIHKLSTRKVATQDDLY